MADDILSGWTLDVHGLTGTPTLGDLRLSAGGPINGREASQLPTAGLVIALHNRVKAACAALNESEPMEARRRVEAQFEALEREVAALDAEARTAKAAHEEAIMDGGDVAAAEVRLNDVEARVGRLGSRADTIRALLVKTGTAAHEHAQAALVAFYKQELAEARELLKERVALLRSAMLQPLLDVMEAAAFVEEAASLVGGLNGTQPHTNHAKNAVRRFGLVLPEEVPA